MALPIEATPVLEGKDSAAFFSNIQRAESHVPTKEDMQKAMSIFNSYKLINQANPNILRNA